MKTNLKKKNPKMIFRQLKFSLIPVIGILIIGFTQCKKETLLELENEAIGFPKNGGTALLTLDYEIESITRMSSDQNITEPIDIGAKTPTINNQHVTMELYSDGTMKLTTVILPTTQDFTIPHQTLPDYTSKPQKTVAYGDKMIFYGESNEILHTENTVSLPTFTAVADKVSALGEDYTESEINEAISSMQNTMYGGELQNFINNIATYNGTITNLGEDVIRVEIPASNFEPTSTDISVLLIDKTRNLLLAARLYDESNNWKSSTMLRYSGGQNPVLVGMKTSVSDVLPTGINITSSTVSTISNMTTNVSL